MKLGKLLGAGKSFLSGRGTVAYRENKGVYLPKFNSEKNPFAPKPAEPAQDATPDATPPKLKSTPTPAPVVAKAWKPALKPAPGPARAIGWTSKLNPFRSPGPAAPPMPGAVQAELSLDAVKVVHNDLMDADIEIVPVKSRTVTVAETPVLPPARQPWEFLGERLIKA